MVGHAGADGAGADGSAGHLDRRSSWLALGAFAVFVVIGVALHQPRNIVLSVTAAIVAMGGAALLLEPRRTLVLMYAGVATAGVAVLGSGTSSNVGWFAVAVLAAWCMLAGTRVDGLVYWGGALGLFGGEWIWAQSDPGWGAWMAGVTFSCLGGLMIRHELDLVSQLRVAQAGLAERSRAEERNRIARELHDIIAHSLTVSLLHVAGARLAIEHDPANASRALAEAERLARASLDEVRNAMGVVRADGQAGTGTAPPLPGLAQVPTLIEGFRSAGADVTSTIGCDIDGLPATTGLAVYRIIQEALTNAAKHANGAPVTVDLSVVGDTIEVTVDSAAEPGHGSGQGLLNMRERAVSLGGVCRAGPGGHGWLVHAVIPLAAGRRRQAAT